MNSMLTNPTASDSLVHRGDLFSAVVLYEDLATRQNAMQICDRLVQKFWADVEFDFSWWRFDFLHDSALAGDAVRMAARSELILLAAHAGRELPTAVKNWIESWLAVREPGFGALVAMIGTEADRLRGLSPIHVYLREAAQRANMDYLPQVIDAPLGKLDTSIETIGNRAEKVSSLLDDILHRPPTPLRWGINE
jgi:hypothetical protein